MFAACPSSSSGEERTTAACALRGGRTWQQLKGTKTRRRTREDTQRAGTRRTQRLRVVAAGAPQVGGRPLHLRGPGAHALQGVRRSRVLAHPPLLLAGPFRRDHAAPDCAHDQVSVPALGHWKEGEGPSGGSGAARPVCVAEQGRAGAGRAPCGRTPERPPGGMGDRSGGWSRWAWACGRGLRPDAHLGSSLGEARAHTLMGCCPSACVCFRAVKLPPLKGPWYRLLARDGFPRLADTPRPAARHACIRRGTRGEERARTRLAGRAPGVRSQHLCMPRCLSAWREAKQWPSRLTCLETVRPQALPPRVAAHLSAPRARRGPADGSAAPLLGAGSPGGFGLGGAGAANGGSVVAAHSGVSLPGTLGAQHATLPTNRCVRAAFCQREGPPACWLGVVSGAPRYSGKGRWRRAQRRGALASRDRNGKLRCVRRFAGGGGAGPASTGGGGGGLPAFSAAAGLAGAPVGGFGGLPPFAPSGGVGGSARLLNQALTTQPGAPGSQLGPPQASTTAAASHYL